MKERNSTPLQTSSESESEFQDIAGLRGGPGILILSPDNQLLHMNRRGWELVRNLCEVQAMNGKGLLPTAITEMSAQIHTLLKAQVGMKDWEQLEVRSLVGKASQPVLLRGFGLPGSEAVKHSRILIVMEVMGRREVVARQIQKRFQLTNREQTVVEKLAKGLTNKEIANALCISEPTVKAHIKHIMEKTKCTTRTAIVAQMLHG